MRKTLFAFLLLLSGLASRAQSPEKVASIKKLLEVTGSANVTQTMLKHFRTSFSSVDTAFWNEMEKEIKTGEFFDLMIPVYDKYYTDSDIRELIAFYSTPIGQKVTRTMPLLTQESMTIGQEWGKKIAEKVLLKLRERGYIKEG